MKTLLRFAMGATCALTTFCSVAAPREIKLPPETVLLRRSELPGAAIAAQKCAICHSADYVSYQPPGLTLAQWTAEVSKMQHAYGAPLTEGEVKEIGAYLAVAYGSAKENDAGVVAASRAPATAGAVQTRTAVADASGALDVKALLNANSCLPCHAIDRKVVGPAYHDVAAKYAGDAQAVTKLVENIRKGGVGRWGPVTMPPVTGLTDAEAKALAEFVLKQ